MEAVERKLRMADLEYTEFYDKIRHQMGRIAKRSAIIEQAQQEEGAEESHAESPDAPSFTDGLEGLSPRQRTLNAQILAGRRRM